MIDERAAIYTWASFMWAGWAGALLCAACMFPYQLAELTLNQVNKKELS